MKLIKNIRWLCAFPIAIVAWTFYFFAVMLGHLAEFIKGENDWDL